jgi:protein-tyrosine kinase
MSRIHDALKKAELEQSRDSAETAAYPTVVAASVEEISPRSKSSLSADPSLARPFTLEDLEEQTPSSWDPDGRRMLFFDSGNTAAQEPFRTLRSRLYLIREKFPIKKLLVGSSMAQEGRSFVAANLAQAMVQQRGTRTLLIDGDLRGGKLHSALGAPSGPGLANYLVGESEDLAVIQRGPMEDLFFIPSGMRVANPLELLANGRITLLLERVEPLFDWIIVDSPPAVGITDAGVLAGCCDAVLLVVRSNSTPYDLAQRARDEFLGKKIIGVVLNGVDAGAGSDPGL